MVEKGFQFSVFNDPQPSTHNKRYLSLHLKLQDPINKPEQIVVSDGLLICWALDNVNNIDNT